MPESPEYFDYLFGLGGANEIRATSSYEYLTISNVPIIKVVGIY